MTTTWTTAECDAKLAALEEQLAEAVTLPTSGSTGKNSMNLAGMAERIRGEMARWRRRRRVAAGQGVRQQRGGC